MTSISEVLIPKYSQWTLDVLWTPSKPHIPEFLKGLTGLDALIKICLTFLLVLLLGWLGRVGWRQCLARRTHLAGRDFRINYWDSIRDLRENILSQFTVGDLISRGISDLNAVRFLLGLTLVLSFDVVFFLIFSIYFMALIDSKLTLACLAPSICAIPLVIKFAKNQEKAYIKTQKKLSLFSEMISKALAMMKFARATATEDIWQKRLIKDATSYAKRSYKFQRVSWKLFPVVNIPTLLSYTILLSLGPQRLLSGTLSPGEMLAFFSYLLLMQTPLYEINQCITEWQKGLVGLRRIQEIMKLKEDTSPVSSYNFPTLDCNDESSMQLAIRAENLSYDYPDGARALHNINFSLNVGERLGITGNVGGGKSTLLRLLNQEITGYQGSLQLFGEEVSSMTARVIQDSMICVPQKPFLFAGTIRYNLCLESDFSEDKLLSILDLVGLRQELEQADRNLDSIIGEWGVSLSGGQKQRLALARALLRPKRVLLLDDAFSAVDSITEKNILDKLDQFLSPKTSILWIAHRRSTLKHCTRVLTLANGHLRS